MEAKQLSGKERECSQAWDSNNGMNMNVEDWMFAVSFISSEYALGGCLLSGVHMHSALCCLLWFSG
jgi:hypothetical protein